jgi:hypothetical protein
MKLYVGIGIAGLLFAGCAREQSSDVTTAAPPADQTAGQGTTSDQIPNAAGSSTRLNSIVRTNAGPDTGVGASATASSGVGTATASGSAAVESDAATAKQQSATGASPAGTGVQNPTVNSNGVGNAGSSTPQNSGSNR